MGEMGDIQAAMGADVNWDEVTPDAPNEVLPAGWYPVMIEKAEVTETKAGDGSYIKMQFRVFEGKGKNQCFFKNIMLKHANKPKSAQIGLSQLKKMEEIIGNGRIKDCHQLIDGMMQVKVKVKDDPQYGPKNEITSFKALEGNEVATQPPVAQAASGEQPPLPFTPPTAAATPTATPGSVDKPEFLK